jgi:hypothetical protein
MSREDVIELGVVSGVVTARVSREEQERRRAVEEWETEAAGSEGSLSLTH